VGPLLESSSKRKYILAFQDDLSRYIVAITIQQQDAETFVLNIVVKFGTPKQVLTDQGSNFISHLFKETCRLLKIKKIQCLAFHSEPKSRAPGTTYGKIRAIGMSGYRMQRTRVYSKVSGLSQ
jgi:hypothetical protein